MTLYKGNSKIRDTGSYGVYTGSTPIGAIYHGSDLVYIYQRVLTFNAGTSLQLYKVPNHVTKIHVDCVASSGWGSDDEHGKGGRVQCDLSVTPGQDLYITVGSQMTANTPATYNAADIRTNNAGSTDYTSLQSRLVVAGGGGCKGGISNNEQGYGGNGGGLEGQEGINTYVVAITVGQGGTQIAGGTGGSSGTFGLGGDGNSSVSGAGGAGWYGGGGSGTYSYIGSVGAGGGGGSSYTHPSLCSEVVHTQGYRNGAGYITITEIG